MEAVLNIDGRERRVEVRTIREAKFKGMLAAGELKAGMVFSVQPEIGVIELSPVETTPAKRTAPSGETPDRV